MNGVLSPFFTSRLNLWIGVCIFGAARNTLGILRMGPFALNPAKIFCLPCWTYHEAGEKKIS